MQGGTAYIIILFLRLYTNILSFIFIYLLFSFSILFSLGQQMSCQD